MKKVQNMMQIPKWNKHKSELQTQEIAITLQVKEGAGSKNC